MFDNSDYFCKRIFLVGQGLASIRPFLSARRDASVYGAQASAERAWLSLQPGMESAMASGALPPYLRALYTQQYQSLEKAYRLTDDPMQKAETNELGAHIMQLLKGKPSGEWAGTYMGKLINLSQGRAAGSMLDLARQGVVLGVSKSQHEITLKIGFDNIPAFLNESYIGQLVNQAVYNILSNAGSRGTQTRR